MVLLPAVPDSGIVFRRTDLPGAPTISADWRNAEETPLCTTLANGRVRVATIEHLMAAFAGCGIDNALVDIDGPEVPIMDGSAAPFVFLIDCAGGLEQTRPRQVLRVLERIEVREPHRWVAIEPNDQFQVHFEIDFDNELVGRQIFDATIDEGSFKREVSRARTFGFLHEVDQLRRAGFALGGSLDNAIVIDGGSIVNSGGLRYRDEFVRHKALDSIGDLYMAGGAILGRFEGIKAGHSLSLRLLKALFADEDAYEWVDVPQAGFLQHAGGALLPPIRAVANSA